MRSVSTRCATIAPIYFGSADLWAALRALAPLLPVFVLTDILLAASRAQRTVGYEVAARSVVEPALLTLSAAGLGLMKYWKATHTRPDVCNEKAAPSWTP